VDWRGDGGARVNLINLSIGGANPSAALAASLAYAARNGILVVAAAGNYNEPVYYPAAYPGALAVGALSPHNQRAGYSCYGPQLSVMAPGGADPSDASESKNGWSGIYSTFPTYANTSGKLYYGAQAGTSMATPVVAGIAALILAQNKHLTPEQLSMRLVATATDLGEPGFDDKTGWGMINPQRALKWVKHDEGTTP
jgi:subtilisin family serine protease